MPKLIPLITLFLAFSLASCFQAADTKEPGKATLTSSTSKSAKIQNMIKLGVDPASFVEGNLYFLLYHEMAHALISEFELPVVGREEDAADRLATLMLTPESKEDDPAYILGAMRGWFLSAEETPLSDIAWWDEHGTDQQRGYQIACLLFGSDPKRFESVAKTVNLPEERRETCEAESTDNRNSWATLFDTISSKQTTSPQNNTIKIIYHPTQVYTDEMAYLKSLGALEDVAETMSKEFMVKPGITIEAEECDQPNAYWYREERSLKICYELIDDLHAIMEKASQQ